MNSLTKFKRALIVAPHPDDEILGMGGSIAALSNAGIEVTILTVAAHMPPLYPEHVHKTTIKEAKQAHKLVGSKKSIFFDHPAMLLKNIPTHEFNASIMEVVQKIRPDIMFIPYRDRHIDHQIVFDACMVVSRPVGIGKNIKVVAAYECLSETHWNAPHLEANFTPNFCIDITAFIDLKIQAMSCYESQVHPFPEPRSLEAIKALALFRGSQAGMGYAEALHLIRMTW